MRRLIVLFLFSVLATGCAGPTRSQREAERVRGIADPARARADACLSAATERAEFAPLGQHMPPQISRVSIEQLNSPDLPTEEDSALLVRRFEAVQHCFQEFTSAIQGVAPTVAAIYSEGHNADRIFLADFLKGGQTWGEYIRRRVALTQAVDADVSAEVSRLQSQLDAAHYSETSLRAEQAAAGLRAVGAGLAGYNAPRYYNTIQPNNITCRPFGMHVTCTRW